MMRASWSLFVLIGTACVATGQESAPAPWANKFFVPKDPPPVIVHDFGSVPWGTTLTHRFVMTNPYAVPMQIMSDPTVSCGCTRILRYTQKMEARESGFIDVEMDARRFQGSKAVTIQVRFGPKYQSMALLQVRAFSRTDVTINPGQISFGTVALGQQPSQTVEIQYSGQQLNWQITAIDDTNASNVKVVAQRINQGRGMAYRLTATLKAEAAPGALQDQIVLRTNDATSPVLTIPVSGMVQAPLAVVQGMNVQLDPVEVGKETVRNVMIRGAKSFKIVKVEGEGDGLTVTYPSFSNPIQVVTISFKPTQPGELKRKLIVHTDQKERAMVTVEGSARDGKP